MSIGVNWECHVVTEEVNAMIILETLKEMWEKDMVLIK